MKLVAREEILGLAEYEQIRPSFRRRVIELKNRRRVLLGKNMSAVFENRDTVLFQVQEMLRTERITREDAIAHEIETYNELVPSGNEFSTTIFVEYPDAEQRERMLVELRGLESRFYLTIDGQRFAGRNETRGVKPDRTTAVHYVKFPVASDAIESIRNEERAIVKLGVDHPAYAAEAVLSDEAVAELRADLL